MPKMMINGVTIDWVKQIPKSLEGEVTKNTIQGGKKPDISTHIKIENRVINLECSVLGVDKDIRYENIYNMGINKEQIKIEESTLAFLRFINKENAETYAMTFLEQTNIGENFIDFNMTLEALKFSSLKMTETTVKTQRIKTKASIGKSKTIGVTELNKTVPKSKLPW